jgi:hypothetical protein
VGHYRFKDALTGEIIETERRRADHKISDAGKRRLSRMKRNWWKEHPEKLDEQRERMRGLQVSQTRELTRLRSDVETLEARSWRPPQWKDFQPFQRAIATLMIENPAIKARAAGVLLDESRTAPLPPEDWKSGGSWERAFAEVGAGRTWFSRLRTLVRSEMQKAGLLQI